MIFLFSDYILVMVANKKSMLQMEDDLEIFLHDRSKEFTKWLFAVLEKLNRVSKGSAFDPKSYFQFTSNLFCNFFK